MADAQTMCAHCQVTISDRSTMVERNGEVFCCDNCAMLADGRTAPSPSPDAIAAGSAPTCAHCDMPILKTTTPVQRDGKTFCCNNCASAMPSALARGNMGPGMRT